MKVKNPTTQKHVCAEYCSFYKPNSKEEFSCRGLLIIRQLLKERPEFTNALAGHRDKPFRDLYPRLLQQCLCKQCEFLVDGCDFAMQNAAIPSPPCGGYIAITQLLQNSPLAAERLLRMLLPLKGNIALNAHCTLKILEKPFLYDIKKDELYELDGSAVEFLRCCDGMQTLPDVTVDAGFLEFCLKEDLLVIAPGKTPPRLAPGKAPVPSLRYLELQLTSRCNLRCKHCYLDDQPTIDMPLSQAFSVLTQFEKMHGLRMLFSGGEPLLYPDLRALHNALPSFAFRKVLLTNGALLAEKNADLWCQFDEIQVSLDGLKDGHESLRGPNTFAPTVRAIEAVQRRGIALSIATMVHQGNIGEFERLARWIQAREVVEWNIDVPCKSGRLAKNPYLEVTPEQGAPLLRFATGGSYHGSEEPFACGYHLCTVTASGKVLKCGFFPDSPLGSVDDGLERAWKQSKPIALTDLACAPCPHLLDCKGGCRFRAAHPLDKDPVMCAVFGQDMVSGSFPDTL